MTGDQIRIGVAAGLIIAVCISRVGRKGNMTSNGFLQVAWAIGSAVLTASIFWKSISDKSVLDAIGQDGALSLFIATGSQNVLALESEISADIKYLWKTIPFSSKK